MPKFETLEYSRKRLEQVIALNAQPVSVAGLINVFGLKSEQEEAQLRLDVQTLLAEGFAFKDKKDMLIPTRPISDLVVARVSESLTSKSNKIFLDIEGVGADFPFNVTLSQKQVKRFPGMSLRKGDTVAVVLDRSNVTELKARLHGKFHHNKKLTIAGKFNKHSEGKLFRPYDNGITTHFSVHGADLENINPKAAYNAAIPRDMDPYNPSLQMIEQKWDPETGASIALVVADKYGIEKYPAREAYIEAKATLRREPPFRERRDLRHEKISVVDPKNAADHDDGILVERTHDGYRTLVVIADVPFYVRPGTELDKAARDRGFSHYFRDETIHMLPHTLTMGVSLLQGQLRPVIYVEKFWDEHGREITNMRDIGLGLIESQMQFSYGAFEDLVFSDNPLFADYKDFGEILTERVRATQEMLIHEDQKNDKEYAPFSQGLVAAMMIDANVAIAEFLSSNDIPFLNRIHGGMSDQLILEEAADQLEEWGYTVPEARLLTDASELNRIAKEAETRQEREKIEAYIRANLLQRAHYGTVNTGHFCLQVDNYTHATSPIRRYTDVIALRAVHTAMQNYECGLSEDDIATLNDTATKMNYLQDIGRHLDNDALRYYAVRDLHRLEGHSLRAELSAVSAYGIQILLPEKGLHKTLKPNEFPEGWKLHNSNKYLIFNDKAQVGPGSRLRVKITNVRPTEAEFDIHNIEPVVPKMPGRVNAPKLQNV
ncbi:MAG: hypothetical protein DI626_05475 [Micavibrio aeruginosavorus]|uniref:RNB domain-containing protein n=1 Tax=Micavibrio aeruginosavorus TaxID=349221 RepID=A0A2W4ZX06_9BACT|nr:MAG: hypothetical protein DI626_05475 [Micavibrio aeruginosavorus]